MLSIPPIDVWQRPGTSGGPNSSSSPHNKELAVERTFKLSHEYTATLNDIFSRFKIRQADNPPTTAVLPLDQPSQLLVLSSYLCLVESYDKILQHIKSWTDVRLKVGIATPQEGFPVILPSVSIGTLKLPTSSANQPLVLTCIIEANMMRMHDLVSEMMRPADTAANAIARTSISRGSTSAGEQGTGASGGDGLSSVAKVTLQAIRAKEDSTLELIHTVWKLALRCGVY
jgi:hypothetical protein